MQDSTATIWAQNDGNTTETGWTSAASWWSPRHLVESAWLEHAPFAFWLVDALRPKVIAELGTHTGFSYFVFCEAITRLRIQCRTFAVDSWQGDDHAGFYGDEIFRSVVAINEAEYAHFSTLLRGLFDDGLRSIEDGSIDLLHIDGRHGYEDVRHDFESWLPKLSDRAVVIFHDTAERQEGFGVWQFWSEIRENYPSFEFDHGHGLGVLGVGSQIPSAVRAFFESAAPHSNEVKTFYETLGARVTHDYLAEGALVELTVNRVQLDALEQRLREQEARHSEQIAAANAVIEEYRRSTSWRVTAPLRSLGSFLGRSR